MGPNTVSGSRRFAKTKAGYALLGAIIAVNIFAILVLAARRMWETEITRDLEAEYLFRARQYKTAIEFYRKKNNNLYPKNLEELFKKKFLRKLYKDPLSESGTWNLVMMGAAAGKRSILIVPEDMLPQYRNRARIIGVCSTSPEEGFLEYRTKKRYSEWAVYVGEQVNKEMPELKFVSE
jgi:hypothetical protein